MTPSRKTRSARAASLIAVVMSVAGVIAGFIAAYLVTAALVGKLPWWAALPLGLGGFVAFFWGIGLLMYRQGSPRSWLTAFGSGGMLALSPTLVLLVHGHPSAEFSLPARFGRSISMSVDTLTAFVVPVGVTIAVVSLAVYLLHPKRSRNRSHIT